MTDPYNVKWKKGSLIRHIHTGKPMLVIDVVPRLATTVVDLMDDHDPVQPLVILMRNYLHWALDDEMQLRDNQWTLAKQL